MWFKHREYHEQVMKCPICGEEDFIESEDTDRCEWVYCCRECDLILAFNDQKYEVEE